MSGTIKASSFQFTEFQKAVLNRSSSRDGRQMFQLDAMSDSVYMERANEKEEHEVKVNMRFLSKWVLFYLAWSHNYDDPN